MIKSGKSIKGYEDIINAEFYSLSPLNKGRNQMFLDPFDDDESDFVSYSPEEEKSSDDRGDSEFQSETPSASLKAPSKRNSVKGKTLKRHSTMVDDVFKIEKDFSNQKTKSSKRRRQFESPS
jgi:hypothetical protein